MKSLVLKRAGCVVVAAVAILCCAAAEVHAKPIRLRNQIIPDNPSVRATLHSKAAADSPRSGLFLVQIAEARPPAWREALRSLGVELLRYVPDDSYVAKFNGVRPNQVEALPFVLWVGEYRAAYKLHHNLQPTARAAAQATELVQVSVLLSPSVTPAETAQVRGQMHGVRQQSKLRSGTVIRGQIPAGSFSTLAQSDAVLWIEPAHDMKLFDEVSSKIVAGDGGPNTLLAQSLGYDGSGVKVAVADSGLNNGDAATMHPDLFGRTLAFFHYGTNLTDAADEHSHGTHVAGIIAGDGATGETDENLALYGLGVAPGASIVAQRIFDGFGNFEAPPSFEKLTRDAKGAGAVIGSNSWGDDTQGRYDTSAMEFDELVRDADALQLGDQPYILEFSAGNAGPAAQSIGSPAVAKNVIATGACQNDRADLYIYDLGPEAMADFSSRGPCEDGRIKPDLVAPGTWIASLQSASAGDENAWAAIDGYYQFQGGTSQAGPHVSGAAAVFVQYYRQTHGGQTPSPALVKAALINSAADMDDTVETGPVPNMDEGWGRVDLTPILEPGATVEYVDQTILLTNNQSYERRVVIGSGDTELKITLTYTDVPGFPAAIPALVNDLDLEVVDPNGTINRGNQFDNGDSVPNAAQADHINNVEGILVWDPLPGEWIVRVRAGNVVEDARLETEDVDQDFALVISGGLASPGQGLVSLDRNVYRAPDQIKVRVVDTDLAGTSNVAVTLTSTTEPAGETKLLEAASGFGTFTGIVAVATGPAGSDGMLQVSHGDAIQARYFDASASAWRTAGATADLVPPVLANVQVTNSFGHMIVTWTSDEPATSLVFFGTNSTLSRAVTNDSLTINHSVALSGLIAGTNYTFLVVSADAAGNASTNDNGGALYSFVALPSAPVLLVDSWLTDVIYDPPPLSGYTDPLDQLGVAYNVWNTGTDGEPTLTDLQPYGAVIWRVPELTGVWSAAERQAISNYLDSGGALFVASMEVFSRIEGTGDTDFIRTVLQVQSYVTDESAPPSTGAAEIIGLPGGGVGAGIDAMMDYTIYEELWGGFIGPDISDTITPTTNASAVLVNDYGDTVGLRWPVIGQTAPGRLVLLTFPLDAVPLDGGVNDRTHLLRNALNFLSPGWNTAPILSLDSSSYTVPDIVSIELAGSQLAGLGTVSVMAQSDSDTNAATITLTETPLPGVFSSTVQLVAVTNVPASGQLQAQNGDTITVDYFNASAGNHLLATATVDTITPSIANVASEPGYEDALITWDTSEASDALVQFGESAFLGKTAYRPSLDATHEIALFGLQPDRTYYYRVVSRDAAGNAAVDDNGGALYSFHTLLPVTPPWSDNMDFGATNWTVFDNFAGFEYLGGTALWTLGVPNNGVETNAHSAPAAWGCNLNGDFIEFADCYLISPAIYLAGGNVATLSFWHSYSFAPEELEAGTLYLATSDATAPTELRTYYGDATDGWELEEIDLTPYVGRVIYLIWNYQLFSLEDPPPPHPGWLVDDVGITMSSVQPGVIQITNNLWQARYVVNGPLNFAGRGLGTTITNAPAGQYVITFGNVAYYQTPTAQTNTLIAGSNIVFQGNYSFNDANHNDISDEFENQKFGFADPSRTKDTDTDHDGMSDWAEFIAGTDPNNPLPPFRITARLLSNNVARLEWPSIPNHAYRVLGSTNGMNWIVCSGWLTNSATNTNFILPPPTNGAPHLFRVAALVPSGANALSPDLRLTATLLQPGNRIRLRWNSTPDHAYRVLGSINLSSWIPMSDWIHPTAVTASYFVPPPTNGAPNLFRLEVRP